MARPCLRLGALIALAAALTAEGAARAAPENPAAAREHYDRGTKFYDIGRYDDAIREFEAAYQAKADPAFIFNLAQAHRLAGHNQEAIRLYRTYLRYVPNPPNREDIESKIAALEKAAADRSAPSTPPPATGTTPPPQDDRPSKDTSSSARSDSPPGGAAKPTESPPAYTGPPPPQLEPPPVATSPRGTGDGAGPAGGDPRGATEAPPRSRRQNTAIAIASIGGGLILTGAVFGLIAENAENRIEEAGRNQEPFRPGVDRLGRFSETMQWVGYGVGLAAVATGLVLYVTGRDSSPDAPAFNRPVALTPLVSASARGAALEVTF